MKLKSIFKTANLYKIADSSYVHNDSAHLAIALKKAIDEAKNSETKGTNDYHLKDTKYKLSFRVEIKDIIKENSYSPIVFVFVWVWDHYESRTVRALIDFYELSGHPIYDGADLRDLINFYDNEKELNKLVGKESGRLHGGATPLENNFLETKDQFEQTYQPEEFEDHEDHEDYEIPQEHQQSEQYEGISSELEEERARKQQHALDLLSRPAPKRYASILNLANRFTYKYATPWFGGKDYIQQKPDGRLIVDNVELDRDDLNAMQSWQDLVDMGVSKNIVGQIAREYGGHPKDVDVWLERNSVPFDDIDDKYNQDQLNSLIKVLNELYSEAFREVVIQSPGYYGYWGSENYIKSLDKVVVISIGKLNNSPSGDPSGDLLGVVVEVDKPSKSESIYFSKVPWDTKDQYILPAEKIAQYILDNFS